MSTEMQVPAHIAARIQANKNSGARSSILDALAGGGDSTPRISIRGGKYRLVAGGVETVIGSSIDVVIVGANPQTSKMYFEGAYTGEDGVGPRCQSADGKRPDASVQDPVCDSCLNCPNNVLGSKINPSGAKSKLCQDVRYLAVVPAADHSQVYQLTVKVSAMKGLRTYMTDLMNYGLKPEYVVTRLGFDDNASYPLVTFARGGWLPEESISGVEQVMGSEQIKICTRESTGSNALPASKPAAQIAPAPVEEVAKAAPVAAKPEPVKAAAPQTSDDLSDLESELDSMF
jgi:hypothetical protein